VAGLLLRAVIGGTVAVHGIAHGRSLDATADWFRAIGFRQPRFQALASAVVETGTGVALLAGLGTPLAAAAVVGTMGVAARAVHQVNGFFITSEGYEYVLNLATASAALAGIGPGKWSADRALGFDRRLYGASAVAVAGGVGLAGAAAQLAAFWRPNAGATSA
jgi:putative oxidoreductase